MTRQDALERVRGQAVLTRDATLPGIGGNIGASMSGIAVSAIPNAAGKRVLDCPDRVLRALGEI